LSELVADREEVPFAFDGAADLWRAWAAGLTPDPDLTVSMWADKHRILSPRGASEAGPWRTSRTPYLRDIMDALSPRHPAQRVVFMKGSQVGASEGGCCCIGYVRRNQNRHVKRTREPTSSDGSGYAYPPSVRSFLPPILSP
jgi:hypothetical protein